VEETMKIKTSAAIAALPLAAAAFAVFSAQAQEQQTVAVASYGGAYQDALRKAFYDPTQEELGIEIRDYTLTGIADLRTQVNANAVEWDIVELYSGQCQQAANEGLLEPLDYSVITNTEGIPEHLVQDHWVGFTAYSTVLAWNTDVYGDNPPKNWADFWNTEEFPGTRSLGGYGLSTNAEIALLADGVAKEEMYPINVDRALSKLEEIKPAIVSWWTSGAQAGQLALNQEADMLAIWVARIEAAMEEGAPYDYTYEQGIMDIECLVVPKGAPNKELAMKVINSFVDPELQANLPQYVAYGPVNQDAYETGKITPDLLENANTRPDNLDKQVIQDKPYWAEHGQATQERWDAFMQQ
jgi:putative spermidine/putrescine transport system substrate-binding protein